MSDPKPNFASVRRNVAPVLDLSADGPRPAAVLYAPVRRTAGVTIDLAAGSPGKSWEVVFDLDGAAPRTLLLTAAVEDGQVVVTARPADPAGGSDCGPGVRIPLGSGESGRVTVGLREATPAAGGA